MSTIPRVSVVLPVYNCEKYVAVAIESLFRQTFRDFEVIAVDDGSRDRSLRIMKRLARKDRRLQIVSRPNTGLVGALQDGLARARGELIARMDADDVCLRERFSLQVAYMDAHPECVLLGAMTTAIDPHGQELFQQDPVLNHESIDAELMKGNGGVIRHPVAMMRKSVLERLGGYRKEFDNAEDVDLFLRLAETGKLANLPQMLLLYRQHYGSVNRTKWRVQAERVDKAVREAAARRGVSLPEGWQYQPYVPQPPEQQIKDWGWKALKSRKLDIARRHARSLISMKPTWKESWRLLACALRGY